MPPPTDGSLPAARAFEQMSRAYVLLDEQFRYVFLNRAAREILGPGAENLVGRGLFEAYPDVAGTNAETHYRRAMTEGVSSRFENYYPAWDRWYDIAVDRVEGGILVGFADITDGKRQAQELADSRETLELVFRSGLMGSFRWDIAQDRVIISPGIHELYGIEPGKWQPVSEWWYERLHPADRERVGHILAQAWEQRAPTADYEFRVRRPDGAWRWIHCGAKFSYDGHGRPLEMIGVNTDVSRQKALEEDLRRRVEELETVMDVAQVAIWVSTDPECRVITGNSTANRIYEAAPNENVSATTAPIRRFLRDGVEVAPADLPMQRAARTGEPALEEEYRVVLPSGAERVIFGNASPLRDPEGRPRGAVGAFLDVTELRKTQHALHLERAQIEAAFQALQDGVILFDMLGHVVLVNEAHARIIGFSGAAEMRRNLAYFQEIFELRTLEGELIPHERWPAARTLRGETFFDWQIAARRLDTGAEWIYSMSGTPVYDHSGEQILALTTVRDITESRRNAEALRLSEVRYRRLMQTCPIGLAVGFIAGERRGEISLANPAFLRLIGYAAEDVEAGKVRWDAITPPQWAAVDQAAIDEMRTVGVSRAFEKEYRRPDGGAVPVLVAAAALPGGDECAAFVVDLSELRQAEKALEQRSLELARRVEEFETLLAVAPVGIAVEAGAGLRLNPAAERMLGDGARLLRDGSETPAGEWPSLQGEFEVVRPDGDRRHVFADSAPLYDEQGAARGSIATLFDATEIRRADARLRESHYRFRRLVESNVVGIVVATERAIVDANDLFLGLIRATRDDLEAGRIDWMRITPPESLEKDRRAIDDLRTRGFSPAYEKEFILPDGTCVPILLGVAAIASEPELTWIAFVADLSQQKELERARERANEQLALSNDQLQKFAYIVAHDLQSPLRSISAMTALLARRFEAQLDDETRRIAGLLQSSVQQASQLISDLLDYSRAANDDSTATKPVDCGTAWQWTLMNLQARIVETGAQITAGPLPVVEADDQLLRVFQNLLENALKYRSERLPEVHLAAERQGGEWVFSLRDNGIGFEPQYAERIFGAFQRLHSADRYPGTGIGLATCRKVIERYGGRIWAEAAPDAGATFYFALPAVAAAPSKHGAED